jgi:hypothetical protein
MDPMELATLILASIEGFSRAEINAALSIVNAVLIFRSQSDPIHPNAK